jgi:hypothetical protein
LARRRLSGRFGREEAVFLVALGGLVLVTVGAVFADRRADPTLVGAFVGLLGLPVFLTADRKRNDDRARNDDDSA